MMESLLVLLAQLKIEAVHPLLKIQGHLKFTFTLMDQGKVRLTKLQLSGNFRLPYPPHPAAALAGAVGHVGQAPPLCFDGLQGADDAGVAQEHQEPNGWIGFVSFLATSICIKNISISSFFTSFCWFTL